MRNNLFPNDEILAFFNNHEHSKKMANDFMYVLLKDWKG